MGQSVATDWPPDELPEWPRTMRSPYTVIGWAYWGKHYCLDHQPDCAQCPTCGLGIPVREVRLPEAGDYLIEIRRCETCNRTLGKVAWDRGLF